MSLCDCLEIEFFCVVVVEGTSPNSELWTQRHQPPPSQPLCAHIAYIKLLLCSKSLFLFYLLCGIRRRRRDITTTSWSALIAAEPGSWYVNGQLDDKYIHTSIGDLVCAVSVCMYIYMYVRPVWIRVADGRDPGTTTPTDDDFKKKKKKKKKFREKEKNEVDCQTVDDKKLSRPPIFLIQLNTILIVIGAERLYTHINRCRQTDTEREFVWWRQRERKKKKKRIQPSAVVGIGDLI